MTPREKREALAAWYEVQLADGVRESPLGSNDGEPMKRYALPREPPASWCARMMRTGLLLLDAFEHVPAPSSADVYKMGAATFLHDWLLRYGQLVGVAFASSLVPIPVERGDICFHVDPTRVIPIHHVSCVVNRDIANGYDVVTTIDGNWGDRVDHGLVLRMIPDAGLRFVRFPIGPIP